LTQPVNAAMSRSLWVFFSSCLCFLYFVRRKESASSAVTKHSVNRYYHRYKNIDKPFNCRWMLTTIAIKYQMSTRYSTFHSPFCYGVAYFEICIIVIVIISSFYELIQSRGVRGLSVLSVCLSICPSVNFFRKSLLLRHKWLDCDQTCTRWSPGEHASMVCSRLR